MKTESKCDRCIFNNKRVCDVNFCIFPRCVMEGGNKQNGTRQIQTKTDRRVKK